MRGEDEKGKEISKDVRSGERIFNLVSTRTHAHVKGLLSHHYSPTRLVGLAESN